MTRSSHSRLPDRRVLLAIGLINALGAGLLVLAVSQHLTLQAGGVFGVGLGLSAYALGIRHAFDADHIAAIDNTTRKLLDDGKDAAAVGFFFSLGHSTVVVALGAVVAAGVGGIGETLVDQGSALNEIAGVWGPGVAGGFLLLIGLLNLGVLVRTSRLFGQLRRGELEAPALDDQLAPRGVMAGLYARATRSITSQWQMYPIGLMFGLGFDTASEIALLLLAGGVAVSGLPFYAVICLPVLFAGAMTLFDTLNSALMRASYAWGLERPGQRLAYNVSVTGATAVSALAIGAISLIGAIATGFGLSGGAWSTIAAIDLEYTGFAIVALLAATWAASLVISRPRGA